MKSHPNAVIGGGSGIGGGVLVVWALSLAGVEVPPEVAAVIAGVIGTAVLFIGHKGFRGLASLLWRGGA